MIGKIELGRIAESNLHAVRAAVEQLENNHLRAIVNAASPDETWEHVLALRELQKIVWELGKMIDDGRIDALFPRQ